jgi:hypothetical protein
LTYPKNANDESKKLTFGVVGQTIVNPALHNEGVGDLGKVAFRGQLMSWLGSALGLGHHSALDIVYNFQPVVFIKGRSVTELDCVLENCLLVVLDASRYRSQIPCPHCKKGHGKDWGWHSNASSSKGGPGSPTVYVACKKRVCGGCHKHEQQLGARNVWCCWA